MFGNSRVIDGNDVGLMGQGSKSFIVDLQLAFVLPDKEKALEKAKLFKSIIEDVMKDSEGLIRASSGINTRGGIF